MCVENEKKKYMKSLENVRVYMYSLAEFYQLGIT